MYRYVYYRVSEWEIHFMKWTHHHETHKHELFKIIRKIGKYIPRDLKTSENWVQNRILLTQLIFIYIRFYTLQLEMNLRFSKVINSFRKKIMRIIIQWAFEKCCSQLDTLCVYINMKGATIANHSSHIVRW